MFIVLAKEYPFGTFMRLLFHMAGTALRPDARGFISH